MKSKKLMLSAIMFILLIICLFSGMQNIAVASSDGEGAASVATWGADLIEENWESGWASYYNNKDNESFGNSYADAYEIKTAQELAIFAKLVREGTNFHGKYVKLTEDVDISSKQWAPIGSNPISGEIESSGQMPFLGTFDAGNYDINGVLKSNHIIKGLSVTYLNPSTYGGSRGLFSTVGSSNEFNCYATVKNLDLVGVYMDMHENPVHRAGAIAGLCSGLIENCNVLNDDSSADLSLIDNSDYSNSTNITGGIVGYLRSGSLKECFNNITVKSMGWTGGIAGRIAAESGTGELPSTDERERLVFNCTNEGNISGRVVGGIGGYVGAGMSGVCNIVQCTNKGTISSTRNAGTEVTPCAGGILGFTSNQMHAVACINEGTVTATTANTSSVSLGGIIGKGNAFISGSYNYTVNIGVGVNGVYNAGALVGHALTIENPIVDNFIYVSYYLKNAGDTLTAIGRIDNVFSDMDKIYIAKTDADFYNGKNSFSDTPTYKRNDVMYYSLAWSNMTYKGLNCWRFWNAMKPILVYENTEFTAIVPACTYNGGNIVPDLTLHLSDGSDIEDCETSEYFSVKYYRKNSSNLYVLMNTGEYPKNAGQYKAVYKYESANDYGTFVKEYEITKRLVTVTPTQLTKYYGNADVDLIFNYDKAVTQTEIDSGKGILENETQLLTGSIVRTVGENIGNYEYKIGTLNAGSNYSLSIVGGIYYTILQRPLNVTIKNCTAVYGSMPVLSFNISNIVNNEKVSVTDYFYNVYYSGSQVTDFEAGKTYSIKLKGLSLTGDDAKNYTLNIENVPDGILTVTKAELIITVNNATKVYGEGVSAITYSHTVTGWKFNDSELSDTILTDFVYSCAGEAIDAPRYDGDSVKLYPILCSATVNSPNYTFRVIAGNLTISQRIITIDSISAVDKIYDGTNIAEVKATFSNILIQDEKELIDFINKHLKENTHMAYFDDSAVGVNKTVHLEINIPSSTLFKNYSISSGGTYTATTSASITPCPMRIIVNSVTNKQYGIAVAPITYKLEGVSTADINNVKNIISNNIDFVHFVTETTSIGKYDITLKDKTNALTVLDDNYFYGLFPNYKPSQDGWYQEGTITVVKRIVNVNPLYVSTAQKIYDGTADAVINTVEGYLNWGVDFPESDKFVPIINGFYNSAKAGETVITVTFTIPQDERQLNEKYTIADLQLNAPAVLKRNVSLVFKNTPYEITYGQKLPAIDFVLSGCIQQDILHMKEIFNSCLNLSGATDNSDAGNYPIFFDSLYKNEFPDYNFSIPATATIKINPAILPVIEFDNQNFTYNGTVHTPTAKIGNQSLENYAEANPQLNLDYVFEDDYNNIYKNAGSYMVKLTVSLTGSSAKNYTFNQMGDEQSSVTKIVTYTVSKIPLTIKANNATMVKGSKPPELSYTISGFIEGENQNNVVINGLGNMKLNCSVTSKSGVGNYPITFSGTVSATNYDIILKPGTLTVSAGDTTPAKNGVIIQGLIDGVTYDAEKSEAKDSSVADVLSNIGEKQKALMFYQIAFKQNGENYVSVSDVTVKLEIPETYKESTGIRVYKVKGNDLEWVNSAVVGGYAVINTKEGGSYVIVCDNVADKSLNYRLMIYIIIGVTLIATIIIASIIVRYKKKSKA